MPVSHTYLPLEKTAAKGDTSVQVEPRVTWTVGDEIVITPTDYDAHAAEVRTITEVARTTTGHSILHFALALEHEHYSGPLLTYGSKRSVRMQSRVGLLTRNIVIRGDGQGEEQSYHFWNVQKASDSSAQQCGNGLCEVGETSLSCSIDCVGSAYEFGASILVGAYREDYTVCDAFLQCQEGYQRRFSGQLDLDNVEIRYFGQNNKRAGLELINLDDGGTNVSVTNVAMNRGYYYAIDIQKSNGAFIDGNLIFRSHLPTLRIENGNRNVISNNLACVAIFWVCMYVCVYASGGYADLYSNVCMHVCVCRQVVGKLMCIHIHGMAHSHISCEFVSHIFVYTP